jgi:A/G-specific adenine glycosylase
MFSNKIIFWYQQNKRDLPWRLTKNPYNIWLSEIILQQTRVNQGLPYYEKFVNKFPSIKEFAEASEDEILRTWQGLGYYSRARNMHTTAKKIYFEYKGEFPNNFEDLLKLKGVGNYTAAAIASFSFDQAVPVVDGNVYRVLSRYFEYSIPINESNSYKIYFELANSLIDNKNPSIFNQAIMELGALICKPQNPLCLECPIAESCLAYSNRSQAGFPLKNNKIIIRNRFFNYLVFIRENKIGLKKRIENDIWQNMYDFPMIESNKIATQLDELESFGLLLPANSNFMYESPIHIHKLSHQKIEAKFFIFETNLDQKDPNFEFEYYETSEIEDLPKPKLIVNFLASYFNK